MRKTLGVTAIILIMAMAAGCGNAGTAASSSASQSSQSSTSSTSSTASSESSTEETGSASGSAARQPGDKATFDDFSNDTISITNASVTYRDGKSIFNAKITWKKNMAARIGTFHIKFYEANGSNIMLQQTLNTTVNPGGTIDIALKYEGDLRKAVKVEYLYGLG